MNYFYGIKNQEFNSELQVPLFQNRNPKPENISLFKAEIENSLWRISKMKAIQSSSKPLMLDLYCLQFQI